MAVFDTYKAIRMLTGAGFSESQAQALVDVVTESQRSLVTTQDLQALELRIEKQLHDQTKTLVWLFVVLGGLVVAVGGFVVAILIGGFRSLLLARAVTQRVTLPISSPQPMPYHAHTSTGTLALWKISCNRAITVGTSLRRSSTGSI